MEKESKGVKHEGLFLVRLQEQHLFGWGSEKSSVSPCSARGNAIPGCIGFYEKQLYVEKGRWREPEKERQQGKGKGIVGREKETEQEELLKEEFSGALTVIQITKPLKPNTSNSF